MIAECLACVLYVPVDVCKERLQVQSNLTALLRERYQRAHPQLTPSIVSTRVISEMKEAGLYYSSSIDALITIMKREGWRGIYKGYGATISSFGPYSALYFTG